MFQSDFIKLISKRAGVKVSTVKHVMDTLTEVFADCVESDEPLTLDIGMFNYKLRSIKYCYNFQKKERMIAGPKIELKYTPTKIIKDIMKKRNQTTNFDVDSNIGDIDEKD